MNPNQQRVEDEVLSALRGAQVQGNVLVVPERLERPLYEKVDEVLRRLGGRWQRKRRGQPAGHLFAYDPAPHLARVLASGYMPPDNPTAYFPTPRGLIDLMLSWPALEELGDGARFLEPSAGDGRIVEALYAKFAGRDISVDCCEILPANQDVLAAKGFRLVAEDFLAFAPERPYTCIVMNPPFSAPGDSNAYMTHIRHAWGMLAEGGFLVAIAPTGYTWHQDRASFDFLTFVLTYGTWEDNEEGSFKESSTTTLFLEKRDLSWRARPYNEFPSWYCWEAVVFAFYGEQERYRKTERVMRLLDEQPGARTPGWQPQPELLGEIRAFFQETVVDARKEKTLLTLGEADLRYLEQRFLAEWRIARDIPTAQEQEVDGGGERSEQRPAVLALEAPAQHTDPGPPASAALLQDGAGAQEHPLSATCDLPHLLGALAQVREIAYYSRARALFLIAEQSEVLVLAFWEGLTLLRRLAARVSGPGGVELSAREAERLFRALSGAPGLAREVDLETQLTHERKRTRRELAVTCRGDFAGSRVNAEALAALAALEPRRLLGERLAAGVGGAGEPALLCLPPALLKAVLQRGAFAALQRYPYSLEGPGESPFHGVSLTVEDSGGGWTGGQWRVTLAAGDGTRLAAYRSPVEPPPPRLLAQAFRGTLTLPSWTCSALIALLPREGDLRAVVGPDWLAVRGAGFDLLSPRLPRPAPAPPPPPATPPAAQVTVSGPALLQALKGVSKAVGEAGIPWERRAVRVTILPQARTLRLGGLTPTQEAEPLARSRRELALIESQGAERTLVVASKSFEQGLLGIKGSVCLAYYDPPAAYALSVRSLVPTGYRYWLRAGDEVG